MKVGNENANSGEGFDDQGVDAGRDQGANAGRDDQDARQELANSNVEREAARPEVTERIMTVTPTPISTTW